jgi:predicted DNA-binding protein with PD1-like motif
VTFSTTEFGYILFLAPGDEVIRCLIQFAREQEVDAAVVTGVGSVSEVELGAGGARSRDQRRQVLAEPLETCSLTGTLQLSDGEPLPHLHGSFARADCSVVGGHIYQAVCGYGFSIAVQLTTSAPPGAHAGAAAGQRHFTRTGK